MELPFRKDVPKELTWDLTLLYPTEEEMNKDLAEAVAAAEKIVTEYKGTLTDPLRINECLDLLRAVAEKLSLVMNYCTLSVETDYYDTEAQLRQGRVGRVLSEAQAKLTFLDEELSAAGEETLRAAMAANKQNAHYLAEVLRRMPHRLSPDTERALAMLGESLETPYTLYNLAKLADMQFPSFTVDGQEHPLGYALFEDDYEYAKDPALRRAAFKAFSAKLRQYENVTAGAYNAQVQKEKAMATLRGHESVFDYLLFDQQVTREMYDRQIDLIMEELSPHMRRYAKLLQKAQGLDTMTFADLKVPLDPDFDPEITVSGAKDYLLKGLSVLGEDYTAMIEEAFRDRWVDFAQNQGKCTGGFCSSPYRKNSFILMTWCGRMSDVLTLSHELGHAGHFRLCGNAQSVFDTEPSMYFIEAPSTTNELIMADHLLKGSSDPRFRRHILSCMVGNTYYHNMVTHLLEAAYQREVYRLVDAGESVNAPVLSALKKATLQKFWGDTVEIDDDAALTWMRQPHYYMGLYSYTYSAGLTIGTAVSRRILKEGAPAVTDWKNALSAGGTLTPAEFAAAAGVDITTDKPLREAIAYIGSLIDEIAALTEQIG